MKRIPDNAMKVDSIIKYINLAYITERTNKDQYSTRYRWLEAFMLANKIGYLKGIDNLMKIFPIAVNQTAFEPFLFPLPYNDYINEKDFKSLFRFRRQIHGGMIDYFDLIQDSSKDHVERYLDLFKFYLGLYYYDRDNYGLAKKFFNGAIYNAEEEKDSSLLSMIYLYSGVEEWEENHPDLSRTYFRQSIDISKKIKDSVKISCAFNNTGQIYLHSGLYAKALDYFDRAIRAYPGKNSDSIAQSLHLSKANACIYLANYSEADNILRSAVTMANRCKDGKTA